MGYHNSLIAKKKKKNIIVYFFIILLQQYLILLHTHVSYSSVQGNNETFFVVKYSGIAFISFISYIVTYTCIYYNITYIYNILVLFLVCRSFIKISSLILYIYIYIYIYYKQKIKMKVVAYEYW